MDIFKLAGRLIVHTEDAIKNIEKAVNVAKNAGEKIEGACEKAGKSVQKAFKTDGVKSFGKSLSDLSKDIKSQQSKLDTLKNKYKDLYLTHGKNSDEAKAVAKEIAQLSKELKTNKEKLAEAEKAANKFDNSLEEVGDETNRTENKMSGALKKIGAAVIAAFSITAIVTFGQACVTAAAQVKAANSQFEQTFGTLQESASAAIERVASSSGILQTRLQGIGTQIYAFAKSSGADSSEAMSLMETSLQATADAAAYYDRSLEETAESLQSFLKGNFENDAALGVSCTETTRNAAAMELFGQKYNDLSEIQKQQTLLKMVTDAQELSGAMGQAARESDGWENVIGNLKEAWTQMQAKLGESTLTALVPAIQKITDGIMNLADNASAVGDVVGNVVNAAIGLGEGIVPFLTEIGSLVMSELLPALTEIGNAVFPILANLSQQIAPVLTQIVTSVLPMIVQLLNTLLPAGLQIITNVLPVVLSLLPSLLDMIQLILDLLQPLLDVIVAFAGPLTEMLVAQLKPIIDLVTYLLQSILPVLTVALTWLSDFITTILAPAISAGLNNNMSLFNQFIEQFKVLIDGAVLFISGALDVIMGIVNVFIALFNGDFEAAGDALLQIITGLGNMIAGLLQAAFFNYIYMVTSNLEQIKQFFSNFGTNISTFFTNLWDNSIAMAQMKLDFLRNAISGIMENTSNIVYSIVEKMKGFFNFEFQVPKMKLPHFSVTPSGWKVADLLEGTMPKLGVEWYAKAMRNPMIMDQPTAFGYDAVSGKILAGGEAGKEVVSGTDTLMQMIQQAVDSRMVGLDELVMLMRSIYALLEVYMPALANMKMVTDTGALIGALTPGIDAELGRINNRNRRGGR